MPPDMELDIEEIIKKLSVVQEGDLQLYTYSPDEFSDGGSMLTKSMPVFYNPIQELNRSITLIAYKAYQEEHMTNHPDVPLKILDSMAASGIRSLRLTLFLADPHEIFANDLNPLALSLIQKNMELNSITKHIATSNQDCNLLMSEWGASHRFSHIIDLDPFGTPNYFIPNAVRTISNGGLLGVTATDTPVLFGVRPSACLRKYNVTALRSSFCKEVGLRILLHYIAKQAHPWMRYIEPVMALSFDHYVRVFVRIKKGKEGITHNLENFGYILWCPQCDWRDSVHLNILDASSRCPLCDSKVKFGGPLWIGKLHDSDFVLRCTTIAENSTQQTIPSIKRIIKTLSYLPHENQLPLGYYNIHKLCDKYQISVSSMVKIENAIKAEGFDYSRTHIEPHAIKSNIDIPTLSRILHALAKE
ncbi:MAG: tRNA (guanine(10)-N(2))-dimethyltransferase [Promethearchaeota archaeon]|nr:MAG: tRNA (guanine(10)-N(2))-dimethyltransferase [Candidatus Lokiarchaeota archaeon]